MTNVLAYDTGYSTSKSGDAKIYHVSDLNVKIQWGEWSIHNYTWDLRGPTLHEIGLGEAEWAAESHAELHSK